MIIGRCGYQYSRRRPGGEGQGIEEILLCVCGCNVIDVKNV
jgi:hypothetical protein